jgi:hypothetical protein
MVSEKILMVKVREIGIIKDIARQTEGITLIHKFLIYGDIVMFYHLQMSIVYGFDCVNMFKVVA